MIVFIWGNLTADNFTPRPGKDTVSRPGQAAGLSASATIPSGRKAQGIDLERLKPPIKATLDDPAQGGTKGHFAIAPIGDNGELDVAQLEAWSLVRGTGQIHEFTQILLDAVVEPNAKGSTQ